MDSYSNNFNKNLAFDFDMFYNAERKQNTAKIIKLRRKKVNLKRFKTKILLFSMSIFSVAGIALTSSVFIFGHSKISETTSEISKNTKILEQELSKNVSLKSKKESLSYNNFQNKNFKNKTPKIEYILNSPVNEAKVY